MKVFFMLVLRSFYAIAFFLSIICGLGHPHNPTVYYVIASVAAFFYLLVGNPRKGSNSKS